MKNYIAIEQALFGDKLTVIYDIDEEVNCCIPSLPMGRWWGEHHVHGIQPCKGQHLSPSALQSAESGTHCGARYRTTSIQR
ncbi:hypothetical protein ACNKHP_05060 [Shigella boydii]